jgi:acetyl esterase/lipase
MKRMLFPVACAFVITLFSTFSNAQDLKFSDEYFIWKGDVPGSVPEDYPDEKWIAGDNTDFGLVQYITHSTIRVFLPDREINTGAAVIICPGGGYNILVIDREGYNVAKAFNKLGIAAIVLKYRHYDTDIAAMDARQAIRYVRAHAGEWDIDAGRIGIGGFSAGGHLSLNSVLSDVPDVEEAADPLRQVSCSPDFLMLIYPGLGRFGFTQEQFGEGFPPVFMINAMDDEVTPVSNMFQLAGFLKSGKVPTEIHVYPGGGHGFDLGNESCNCSDWPELFRDWLRFNNFIPD